MRCLFLILAALALAQLAPAQPPAPTTSTAIVFVPYEKATGPLLGPGQSVMLSYAEFLRLRGTAAGKTGQPEFRPVASLAQAVYQGTVEGDVARLDVRLTIEALARPTDLLEIRLPFHGAAVESAEIDGPKSSLGPLGEEMGFRLWLFGEGRRTLTLKLAVPLSTAGATRRLDFAVPRAAAASLALRVSGDVMLERDPDTLPATTESAAGATLIKASAGSSERLVLAFRPRAQATGAAAQARMAVDEQIRLAVSPRGAQAEIKMKATLLAGQTSALMLEVPAGARLLGVSGPFVKDWSAPDAQRRVTVALVREVAQPFDLTVTALLETAATTESARRLAIPEFRVPGAVQESGSVTIVPEDALAIWPEQTDGLEPVSAGTGEGAAARKFHFSQPGWRLVLTRRPIPARIRATGLSLYEVTDELTRLKTRQQLGVGGRGVFSVTLLAPEGYQLREAGPDDVVAGFRQQGRRVEINFRGEQVKGCNLELLFHRPGVVSGGKLTVEPVTVEGADENSGYIVVAMPTALRATEQGSSGVEATDIRALAGSVRPLLTGDIEPVLGYRYFTPAARAAALIERQRTRLSCETGRLVTITPSLMRVDANLNFNVEFSSTDLFQVMVPASAGEDVRFSGADIKERARAATSSKDAGALTTWTIRLQRRVLGPYTLGVSFETPIPAAPSGKAMSLDIPVVRAAGVARETGFIAVSRGENLEVKVEKSEGLETRDVKELPSEMASAFLGFRYYDPARQALRLGLTRHDLESVLGALVRRLHIETVVSDHLDAVHEVIFEVQNNNRQYLELMLPKGMEIWSAFVRGVPVRSTTRQSDGARLIELTKSDTMDSAFRVRLILNQKMGDAMGSLGRLSLDSPKPLGIPVLRTTWKLYLPPGYRYVNFGGTMRQETGNTVPWIEPAAEKLLNDLPAKLAGGIARPTLNPPVQAVGLAYNADETDAERKARLQGAALEIPIVREGVPFQFSMLSDTGSIEVSYWKRKPLLVVQGLWGALLFVGLLVLMIKGQRLWTGLAFAVGFFILASLTGGLPGRMFATAYIVSAVALIVGFAVHEWRRLRATRAKAAPETPETPATANE